MYITVCISHACSGVYMTYDQLAPKKEIIDLVDQVKVRRGGGVWANSLFIN